MVIEGRPRTTTLRNGSPVNINLGSNYPIGDDGEPESMQTQIEEHQDIMQSTGYETIGPPVLVPEGPEYPGSYQVWSPFRDGTSAAWVYVNPDGVALILPTLPSPEGIGEPS